MIALIKQLPLLWVEAQLMVILVAGGLDINNR